METGNIIEVGKLTRLELGYVGEGLSRAHLIDVSAWQKEWPEAAIGITVERPDGTTYPAATSITDGVLTWVIRKSDTAVAGQGWAQILATSTEDGFCYKSRRVRTNVNASNSEEYDPDAPEPLESWMENAIEQADRAEEARDAAEGSEEAAAGSATAAAGSATEAAGSATEAAGSATEAAGSATEAAGSATEAGESARQAKVRAQRAFEYSGMANEFSDSAKGYRNEAEGYRNEAEGYRNEAEASKELAILAGQGCNQFKEEAAASAEAAAASAQEAKDIVQGIESLPGTPGEDGASAYEIAVENGFVGTEAEWLASLKGDPGEDGRTPEKGVDYWTAEDRQQMVQDVVAEIPVCAHYYPLLSTAITDINNGTTENAIVDMTAAKVRVTEADNGRTLVMLMDNVEESVRIDFRVDVDLALNGKRLTRTGDGTRFLYFNAGTDCTIDGTAEGSSVEWRDLENTYSETVYMITGVSCKLSFRGGSYVAQRRTSAYLYGILLSSVQAVITDGALFAAQNRCADDSGGMRCIYTTETELTVRDSIITAVSERNNSAYIFAYGLYDYTAEGGSASEITIINSTIKSDSKSRSGVGILNYGNLRINNSQIYATYTGVRNYGALYVNGGIYSGYGSGGCLLQNNQGQPVYINDATLRCGEYVGEYATPSRSSTATCLGINSENTAASGTAYIDGCTFEAPDDAAGSFGSAISLVYSNNGTQIVNISNSAIVLGDNAQMEDRIRTGGVENRTVNVGSGGNITADYFDYPERASFTGQLYRRNSPDKALDGRDFEALRAGAKGEKGDPGEDGQSAYSAAQSGGYTGSQADFYGDLAAIAGLEDALDAILGVSE